MNFIIGLIYFKLSLTFQYIWLKIQRRIHLTQAQKTYGVNIDVNIKSKTPSTGGIVFVLLGVMALLADLSVKNILFWSLPLLSGLIGFIDDFGKLRSHTSEGLTSLAKLKLQLILCLAWSILAEYFGLNGLWPGFLNYAVINILISFLFSAGMLNAVNITDGLDGLAAGSFLISIGLFLILIPLDSFNAKILTELFFIVSGFLFYNIRPAKTFMGDTGSHFLGGALAALCILNGRALAVIPTGFIFIIEMFSSGIQIFTIRKLNKKIFLMAPLHHHFQKLGHDETAVTLRFWLVHSVCGMLLSLLLLDIF